MTDKLKLKLEEARAEWTEEHIPTLLDALEVAVRRLASIEESVSESFEDTGDYDSHSTQWVCPFCNTRYEHDDDCEAKLIAEDLRQIEARLGGE